MNYIHNPCNKPFRAIYDSSDSTVHSSSLPTSALHMRDLFIIAIITWLLTVFVMLNKHIFYTAESVYDSFLGKKCRAQ